MKSKNSIFNTVIIVLGVILLAGLTWAGFNSSSKSVATESHDSHVVAPTQQRPMAVKDIELPDDANLDEVVEQALIGMQKGKESGDMVMMMNEGIMRLKAVVNKDSNHVNAIYQLGIFSIESGQLQKAEKRFEKLILLQPENQEYKNTLQEIRTKLEN